MNLFDSSSSQAAAVLHRMAWGPCPADLDHLRAAGFPAYVEEQLAPWTIDDNACEIRLVESSFASLGLSAAEAWRLYYGLEKDFLKPFRELALSSLLRCVASRRQLLELMVHFWHDHFHVTGNNSFVAPAMPQLNSQLRRHALGNFHAMLLAVASSPAMMLFLDNAYSKAEDPNENYARELLELHTLGVDGGYGEEDVAAAARIFTGWTVAAELCGFAGDGEFAIRDEIHDHGEKRALGHVFPAGRGAEAEGLELLGMLARHPATARHVAFKLCRRLVSDRPPAGLVEKAAAVFYAKLEDPDQIAATLRVILLDPAFRASWGEKIKRPFEIAVATLRGCGFTPPLRDDGEGAGLLRHLQAAGQQPFDWGPPNGFPDFKEAWNGAGTRMMSWRLVNFLLFGRGGGPDEKDCRFRPLEVMAEVLAEASPRRAGAMVDFWARRLLGRDLPAAERAPLVVHLRAGAAGELADRLRSTIALICMTPSFLER